MRFRYPAVVELRDEHCYIVRIPSLGEFTQGETREEALAKASRLLSSLLLWRLDNDMPLPECQEADGDLFLTPDDRTQTALLIRRAHGRL